jgi:hypothetical protein
VFAKKTAAEKQLEEEQNDAIQELQEKTKKKKKRSRKPKAPVGE